MESTNILKCLVQSLTHPTTKCTSRSIDFSLVLYELLRAPRLDTMESVTIRIHKAQQVLQEQRVY